MLLEAEDREEEEEWIEDKKMTEEDRDISQWKSINKRNKW